MKHIYLLPVLCVGALVSCSDDKTVEPDPTLPERLTTISSSTMNQSFGYDAEGRVSAWTKTTSSTSVESKYDYSDPTLIGVNAVETYPDVNGEIQQVYTENLYLDEDMVSYAEGSWTQYQNGVEIIKKRYRNDFIYDSQNRLVTIKVTEWNWKQDDWDISHPWTWENKLTWDEDNLTRYDDYSGYTNPRVTYQYRYFGSPVVTKKVEAYPEFRSYYAPLQLAGLFGRQPESLVKTIIRNDFLTGHETVEQYSYNFSVSTQDSRIESYSITTNGSSEVEYKVSWR